MNALPVVIASDHGGIELRKAIIRYLKEANINYEELGPQIEEPVDYPDLAFAACEKIIHKKASRAILICGTGIGMSIAANKMKGIRCALVSDSFSARATREHNDTNALALGARVIGPGLAVDITKIWLHTDFTGGRHIARLEKIKRFEGSNGDDC